MEAMIITPSSAHYGQLYGDLSVATDELCMARCACVSCNSCTCACACRSGDQPDFEWEE